MMERDPLRILKDTRDNLVRYIQTAFGTRYPSLEQERKTLLETKETLFQTPYIEPILEYTKGKRLEQLEDRDLPGLDQQQEAFKSFSCCS